MIENTDLKKEVIEKLNLAGRIDQQLLIPWQRLTSGVAAKATQAAIILVLLSTGCADPNRAYERNVDFSNNLWLADSIVKFEFEIVDTQPAYNLYYNVRNSISYPYHNLYVQYTLEDSLGNVMSKALQNMDLFDPVTGKPKGDGLGDIFDHRILAIPQQRFSKEGWYRFKIQQFMRQDSLPLILSMGLRVEKTN